MIEKLPVLTMVSLSTIIQVYACLYFAVQFWGIRLEHRHRYILYGTILITLFTGLHWLYVPTEWRPIVSLPGQMLILFSLFRHLPLRERSQIAVTQLVGTIITEIGPYFLLVESGLLSADNLLQDPRQILPYLMLTCLSLIAVSFVMDRRDVSPGKTIVFTMGRQGRHLSGLLFLFILNLIITSALYIFVSNGYPAVASFLLFATSIVSIAILLFIVRAVSKVKDRALLMTQETYVEQIDSLFTTIRGQRHDFLNHVQVIQSFVRRGKLEDLDRYVTELVGEIVEINDLIQIGHPALAALIKSKMVYALDRKIDFRYSFEGMSRLGNGIASVDYVKIAGNLIDNALHEALQRPREECWVDISGWTDQDYLYLSVSNPGCSLTEDQKTKLFLPGYTTKENQHSGIGLSIVKERVSYYQGDVAVENIADQILSFQVKLPLRIRSIPS
jgi:signal transduction histidine kinase